MPIKSFRGLLVDGGQDQISLHTNDGSTGYRIVKFELMANRPMQVDSEHIVQIFSVKQSNIPTGTTVFVDFNEQTLLAAANLSNETTGQQFPINMVTIFDNMTFNQDIYVTHTDVLGAGACNYYIELEQIKLSLDENTVATLKDIRNIEQPSV